jgi:hypothetical protein
LKEAVILKPCSARKYGVHSTFGMALYIPTGSPSLLKDLNPCCILSSQIGHWMALNTTEKLKTTISDECPSQTFLEELSSLLHFSTFIDNNGEKTI